MFGQHLLCHFNTQRLCIRMQHQQSASVMTLLLHRTAVLRMWLATLQQLIVHACVYDQAV
jgi:hypothetical protein